MAKTYIVDGNSLLFRAYYSTAYTGNLMMTKKGIPTNAIFAFHNLIKKIKAMVDRGDHLFVAFDCDSKTFRKEEFKEYKAQRKKAPDELIAQMPMAREMLESMDIKWAELHGYEGDDIAGSLARYAVEKGDEVRLFTSDKDFLQLLALSDDVTVEMLKKGLTETICYNKSNLKELFGLNPDQITDFKGIAGDPSDNYKGIAGIGEKTAMKLLNDYGHLEDIINHCKEDSKSKTSQKILQGEEDAIFFKKLAEIYTALDVKDIYEESLYKPYNRNKLLSFYNKYELSSFIKGIDKLKDVEDDTIISIFNCSIAEDKQVIDIKRFDEIKEEIYFFTYKSDSENENISVLTSFIFANKNNIYSLNIEDALKDDSFDKFLKDESKDIQIYDIKGLDVLLERYGLPKLNGKIFDILLASYLYDSDIGSDRKSFSLKYLTDKREEDCFAISLAKEYEYISQLLKDELEKRDEMSLLFDVETPLARILASMESEGVPLSKSALSIIDAEYKKKLYSLEEEIYSLADTSFNINSPKQLESILFDKLKIKRNKGEKGTGIDVLNAHIDDHPIVSKIIQYRLYNKLVTGYTSSLPDHVLKDNKIHALFNQNVTATGRLSMSEPNLQNISIRNEEGKSIRKAFFYDDDENYFLSLDYSQIELRVLAHVADIKPLKDIFLDDEDIHKATASKVFNVPIDEVTSDMRRKAKAVNFGIIYGISPYGLSQQLDISTQEAKYLIDQFKEAFKGVDDFQESCISQARDKGYVKTILNRRRYLKDINSSNRFLKSFSERAAVNSVIQGSAADLIKVAMIKCDKLLKNYKTKMILQIHDELIFKVPKDEIDVIVPLLKECMDSALKLSVPLQVEGQVAKTWYEVH